MSFRFSDMAAYAGAIAHGSELSYTLKVTAGWVYDKSQASWLKDKFGFTDRELEAVEHCFTNLILSKVDHTISIKDDGSVDIKIEYIANAAGILRSPAANVMTHIGLMAFDDAVAAIEEEIRSACEGTDGGGRKQASDVRNASKRVRDRLMTRSHSAMIRRLEGNRGTGFNTSYDTGDPGLNQKLSDKVKELLGNPEVLDKGAQSVQHLSKTEVLVDKVMSGDDWQFEPTDLPERMFLVMLNPKELNWLNNYGLQWKQQAKFAGAFDHFENIGSLQGFKIKDDEFPISTDPVDSQIADGFEKAELKLLKTQEEQAAAGAGKLSDSWTYTSSGDGKIGTESPATNPNRNLEIENPTLFLRMAHDDYKQSLNPGNLQDAAEASQSDTDDRAKVGAHVDRSNHIRAEKERYVYYFFLQDLIEVLFSIVKENAAYIDRRDKTDKNTKNIEKTKMILGSIEIYVPGSTVSRHDAGVREVPGGHMWPRSLGDMPISVSYFRNWLISNVVQRNKKTYYILDFIKDIVRDLVVGPLNDTSCWGISKGMMEDKGLIEVHGTVINAIAETNPVTETADEPMRKMQTEFLAYHEKHGGYYDYTDWYKKEPGITLVRPPIDGTFPALEDRPVLVQDNSRDISSAVDSYEYVVFYASQIHTARVGDIVADTKDGVYHYSVGNNKGIVKTIKFTKAEAKGVREARLEQVGAMRNSRAQLMDKYDVELEVFGTVAVLPGTQIYIDPFGLSPLLGNPSDTPERINRKIQGGALNGRKALENVTDQTFNSASLAGILGIGGYYIIIESTSYIEAGKYMSKIKAMFDHFGGSTGLTQTVDPATDKSLANEIDCDAKMIQPQAPGTLEELGDATSED